ncbi:MAG: hypothetical protein NC548_47030 [Lachnospiraceae bacterium]|nr:hypothetical protein [Lachnospiraceae bacterium]
MKIYIRSASQPILPASKQVNRVGKYLYKHLDGAFRYAADRNMYDVYVTLLYQLKPECGGETNDVREMTININITTYQNKIRINTIEMNPVERTLGFDLMKPEEMMDLEKAQKIIIWKVGNRIRKAYKDYLILF